MIHVSPRPSVVRTTGMSLPDGDCYPAGCDVDVDVEIEVPEWWWEAAMDDLAAQDDATAEDVRGGIARRLPAWRLAAAGIPVGAPEPGWGPDPADYAAGDRDALADPEAFRPFAAEPYNAWAMLDGEEGPVRSGIVDAVGDDLAAAWRWWARARRALLARLARQLSLLLVAARRREPRPPAPRGAVPALRPLGRGPLRCSPRAAHAPPRRAYLGSVFGGARLLAVA